MTIAAIARPGGRFSGRAEPSFRSSQLIPSARIAGVGLLACTMVALTSPRAFAQGMMEAVPRSSGGAGNWKGPSLVLPEPGSATPAPAPSAAAPQSNNELTLPSMTNQQASMPPPAQSDNTKIIPVIPPQQDVLVLPQASRDFLGHWGGQLTLVNKFGAVDVPETALMSFTFGERNGQVVLATTVFGSPDSQVLKTSAEAEGPSEVKLEVKGLDLSQQPPIRHVEKVTIALAGSNQVRCTKQVDLYVPGVSGPAAEAVYEGTLTPMTRQERRMISEELMRSGDVPRATINEGNLPPQPME